MIMGEESLVSVPSRRAVRTSFLANAFSPSKAFIEPLSSSTRTKSIGIAQGGLGMEEATVAPRGGGDGGGAGQNPHVP